MEEKTQTILLVDDDSAIIKMLESILRKEKYNTISATEAAYGLQIAMDKNPDLIILDVMMPIINGYNFCRLLKSEEGQKDIPIIFLTSRNELEDIKIGKEMGAEAYLTKPVNTEELLSKIKELL